MYVTEICLEARDHLLVQFRATDPRRAVVTAHRMRCFFFLFFFFGWLAHDSLFQDRVRTKDRFTVEGKGTFAFYSLLDGHGGAAHDVYNGGELVLLLSRGVAGRAFRGEAHGPDFQRGNPQDREERDEGGAAVDLSPFP